jgi:hypothetical protein
VNVQALLATGVNADGYREIVALQVTSAEEVLRIYPHPGQPSERDHATVANDAAAPKANRHARVSCVSLPLSSAIGRQITDVVTSGGQNSTKFVLRTIGACVRDEKFAVPVTLTVS